MTALNAVNIIDSIVPISRFNKGEANKIFSDVKKFGTRIVVKNNVPECVLMSPRAYQDMMEEYENAILLAEAGKRLSESAEYIDHDAVMEKFGLSEADLDDVEVNLE
ncbi:MAG: type II toxin-antitoxin system Phd/YefM family antitoxin [Treponema sp.]|nr:type II toxin-antitoxin system Phd/YefM family antitoxin [Treponema sp.]